MTRSKNGFATLFAFLAIGALISGAEAKPPKRIWGGRLATGSEFGAVITLAKPGHIVNLCGGVIIGPRFILTAGHCVNKRTSDEIGVRAGIHDLRDTENAVERRISKFFVHPDYLPYIKGKHGVRNDIAILVLEEALPIAGRISKFKLPEHQPEDGLYFIAGWGKNQAQPTETQFELKTLTMTLGHCNGRNGTFCASDEHGSVCPGDSGSPLVRGGHVYGIASAGFCEIGASATFTDVFYYIDWVNNIISTN